MMTIQDEPTPEQITAMIQADRQRRLQEFAAGLERLQQETRCRLIAKLNIVNGLIQAKIIAIPEDLIQNQGSES